MGAQISHAVAVRSGSHKHQSQAQRKPRDRSRQTSLISFSLGFSFHLLPVVHACGPRPDRGRAGAPEDLLKSKIVFGFDAGPGGPVRSTRRRRAFTVLVIRICYFVFDASAFSNGSDAHAGPGRRFAHYFDVLWKSGRTDEKKLLLLELYAQVRRPSDAELARPRARHFRSGRHGGDRVQSKGSSHTCRKTDLFSPASIEGDVSHSHHALRIHVS
jgi:hypothetical protein